MYFPKTLGQPGRLVHLFLGQISGVMLFIFWNFAFLASAGDQNEDETFGKYRGILFSLFQIFLCLANRMHLANVFGESNAFSECV